MVAFPAHRVATPVLERPGGSPTAGIPALERPRGEGRGVVLGAGATAAWIDLGGFVVAVTTREVPLLPNAVAVAAGSGALAETGVGPGQTARFAPGRVELGALRVTWDPAVPPAWNPAVPQAVDADIETVARRGAALLYALGLRPNPHTAEKPVDSDENLSGPSATFRLRGPQQPGVADAVALVRELASLGLPTAADPDGGAELTRLLRAVRERDPEPVARATRGLLGRGPGLTPEGDDLLAAVAGTLAVLGPAAGLDGPALNAFLAALGPEPGRTTALSATLLELAARGLLAEPAGRLLDLRPAGDAAWPAALARLQRLGHGSGRAYAAGIAASASLLAAGAPAGGFPGKQGKVDSAPTRPRGRLRKESS